MIGALRGVVQGALRLQRLFLLFVSFDFQILIIGGKLTGYKLYVGKGINACISQEAGATYWRFFEASIFVNRGPLI